MKNNNSKLKIIAKRYLNFDFCVFQFTFKNRGVALLLVIVILSAILSVSIGIFNVVLGELLISGEISDSFIAFYAADTGIERMLYRDRNQNAVPGGVAKTDIDLFYPEYHACYSIRLEKSGGENNIFSFGQYRCGPNDQRIVKRGFLVTY